MREGAAGGAVERESARERATNSHVSLKPCCSLLTGASSSTLLTGAASSTLLTRASSSVALCFKATKRAFLCCVLLLLAAPAPPHASQYGIGCGTQGTDTSSATYGTDTTDTSGPALHLPLSLSLSLSLSRSRSSTGSPFITAVHIAQL